MNMAHRGRDILFEGILSRGFDLRVRVTGRSMSSALRSGEVVTVRKAAAASLRTGDLVLFRHKTGGLMLHRVLYKRRMRDGAVTLRTKGDALKSLDRPVRQDDVLGRVYKIEREGRDGRRKHIALNSLRWVGFNRLIAVKGLSEIVARRLLRGLRGLRSLSCADER